MIFDQSVKYKTEVEKGTTVVLKVSKGPEKIPMPNCVGRSLEEVTAMLNEMQINYQLIPNYSAQYEYNVVYDQSVEEGTEVAVSDRMTKVYIYYGALEEQESSGGGYHGGGNDDDEEEENKPKVNVIISKVLI